MKGTITITFGDVTETHAGMEKHGSMLKRGFRGSDLFKMRDHLEEDGYTCELVDLTDLADLKLSSEDRDGAYLLIVRNAYTREDADALYQELVELDWDKKMYDRGKVKNKRSRYNLCFAEYSQEPDYEHKKGRVVSFADLPLLSEVRGNLQALFEELKLPFSQSVSYAEGNYYYDSKKCYIGWHGDAERKTVIALRLGETMPLSFQWYHRFSPLGETFTTDLNHGDLYIMGEKAVGTDWKRSSQYTLRHAVNKGFPTPQ